MNNLNISAFFFILLIITSCSNKTKVDAQNNVSEIQSSIKYFSDSLLMANNDILEDYLEKYQSEKCGNQNYTNKQLKDNFKGIKIIKNIRNNAQQDTVFVVPSFNYCDDGESYVFYDKSIPRLLTDSYCCNPDNLFVIDDINEDGINEIGIYYSSCVSRYKSLRIFSLKQNYWHEIARSMFDINTQDPDKVEFGDLVLKIEKNQFKICNFEDGKTEWKIVIMK
ncbi:hypothetical protein VUJ46_14785 [Chryseobacterium sp. MYb264]|uniref:hypothetical protein n=1 Tax=Chryseobacterium sp. MYb264 TaxID=2745153 RepID=UPI002E11D189|nr:hypothetical protein VUJ46_14785 [Chryseobacterium sp. MYb264]